MYHCIWWKEPKARVALAALALLLTLPALFDALAGPLPHILQPDHHVPGVVEGQVVKHDFIVENRGDQMLEIVGVNAR